MQKKRTAIMSGWAASLLCVLMLSACHGGGPRAKMRWVSPTDADQTMEFRVRDLSVIDRVHMAIMQSRPKGTYVVKKGDTVLEEGTLTQEPTGYVLKSVAGKEQRLEVEKTGSLKGENGTIWNLQDPPTAAVTLRKW